MIIDTYVFRLNEQPLYFQFHYSYSIDSLVNSLVNMVSKMRKVLILDEHIRAIKLVESEKCSRKVAEEFSVGCS